MLDPSVMPEREEQQNTSHSSILGLIARHNTTTFLSLLKLRPHSDMEQVNVTSFKLMAEAVKVAEVLSLGKTTTHNVLF